MSTRATAGSVLTLTEVAVKMNHSTTAASAAAMPMTIFLASIETLGWALTGPLGRNCRGSMRSASPSPPCNRDDGSMMGGAVMLPLLPSSTSTMR
jgi:hypothetical protein